jgi:hypothetical protein
MRTYKYYVLYKYKARNLLAEIDAHTNYTNRELIVWFADYLFFKKQTR